MYVHRHTGSIPGIAIRTGDLSLYFFLFLILFFEFRGLQVSILTFLSFHYEEVRLYEGARRRLEPLPWIMVVAADGILLGAEWFLP